jgi:hypothetical protein
MAERDNILHLRDQKDKIRWKNLSGEVIPAYAVVKLSSYNAVDKHYNAVKPDGEGSIYHLSGPVAVAVDAYGESVMWNTAILGLTFAAFNTVVGPVANSWEMSEEGTGFVVFSDAEDGVAAILQVGGGTGTHEIWFRIVSVECVSPTETILTVEPTWYTGGCTKDIPGQDPYTGYVTVEDVCSILRFYTAEWLGSGDVVGRATYMYPRSGYCTATWLVDTICGIPDCA